MRTIERKILQMEALAKPQQDIAAAKAMAELSIALMTESLRDNPDHPCQEAMAEQRGIIRAIDNGTYRHKPQTQTKDQRAAHAVSDLRAALGH